MADKTMTVFKALRDGVSPYQHYPWPLPADGKPGDWVDTVGKPALCANGVHGYLDRKRAESEGNQVFEMELEGNIVKDKDKAAGQRGRLLRQLSGTLTVTLADLIAAAGAASSQDGILYRAAAALGVAVDAIVKALKPQDVYVVADDGDVVRLEEYLKETVDPTAVAGRIRPLGKMTLKLAF